MSCNLQSYNIYPIYANNGVFSLDKHICFTGKENMVYGAMPGVSALR